MTDVISLRSLTYLVLSLAAILAIVLPAIPALYPPPSDRASTLYSVAYVLSIFCAIGGLTLVAFL